MPTIYGLAGGGPRNALLGSDWVGGTAPDYGDLAVIPAGCEMVAEGEDTGFNALVQAGGLMRWEAGSGAYGVVVVGGGEARWEEASSYGTVEILSGLGHWIDADSSSEVLIYGGEGRWSEGGYNYSPVVLEGGLATWTGSGSYNYASVFLLEGNAVFSEGAFKSGLIYKWLGAVLTGETIGEYDRLIDRFATANVPAVEDVRQSVAYAGGVRVGTALDLRSGLLAGQSLRAGLLDASGNLKSSLRAPTA